jgi:hypothetical protein
MGLWDGVLYFHLLKRRKSFFRFDLDKLNKFRIFVKQN